MGQSIAGMAGLEIIIGARGGEEDIQGRLVARGAAMGVGSPIPVELVSVSGAGRREFWWPGEGAED